MTHPILAQIAALKTMPAPQLKARWRELFDKEPPPYNRRFLESRLAYRIQELAHSGLSRTTIERLDALADGLEGKLSARRRIEDRPIVGTRLIREWKGVAFEVTVRNDHFEYQGRPYKSLTAIARLITGTQWNGHIFFGLRTQKRR